METYNNFSIINNLGIRYTARSNSISLRWVKNPNPSGVTVDLKLIRIDFIDLTLNSPRIENSSVSLIGFPTTDTVLYKEIPNILILPGKKYWFRIQYRVSAISPSTQYCDIYTRKSDTLTYIGKPNNATITTQPSDITTSNSIKFTWVSNVDQAEISITNTNGTAVTPIPRITFSGTGKTVTILQLSPSKPYKITVKPYVTNVSVTPNVKIYSLQPTIFIKSTIAAARRGGTIKKKKGSLKKNKTKKHK